jgi:hypothetical protein
VPAIHPVRCPVHGRADWLLGHFCGPASTFLDSRTSEAGHRRQIEILHRLRDYGSRFVCPRLLLLSPPHAQSDARRRMCDDLEPRIFNICGLSRRLQHMMESNHSRRDDALYLPKDEVRHRERTQP